MLWALACALLFQGGGRDLDGLGYGDIEAPDAMLQAGPWRAWLESPGGELPFELVIVREGAKLAADIQNGEESIRVPETRVEGDQIVFDIPHYDSRITASIAPLGTRLDGEWKKRSGVDRWTTLKFHAEAGAAPRFKPLPEGVIHASEGRWSVNFVKSEESGVLILRKGPDTTVEGTFLMPTGDFRWLAGSIQGKRVRLSCFDGAHAFLFDAKIGIDDWVGKFWSGDRWEDTWLAEFDSNASLPDGFDQAHWRNGLGLAQLLYPDLNGVEHSLGEAAFSGKAIVIQVLGSWCPNCHDEMAYLAKVYDRYRERGLSVVGLAFEVTGDWTRDAQQVRRMRDKHAAKYPVLLAGSSDKQKASEAFPALDHVLAFPTTIFLHRDGRVRAVHSGFAGPATKEEHEKLAKKFEQIIEELLAEPDANDRSTWSALSGTSWREDPGGRSVDFVLDDKGQPAFKSGPNSTAKPIEIRGSTVSLAGVPWHYDRAPLVLLDPQDFRHRIRPASRAGPMIDGQGITSAAELFDWLGNPDPLVRREAAFYMPRVDPLGRVPTIDPSIVLSDPDVLVRCVAAGACARLRFIEAGPMLVALTKAGFSGERREAARAIGELGFKPGADALRSLAADLDPLVREAAARALQKLGAR